MLKRHGQLFQAAFWVADMTVVLLAWVVAYGLRFLWGPIPAPLGIPPFAHYLTLAIFIPPIFGSVMRAFGLYHVTRGTQFRHEALRLVQSASLAALAFTAAAFLFWEKELDFSRGVFVYFWAVSIVLLLVSRSLLRIGLRWLRRRGWNQRYVLVVGAGDLARTVAEKIREHPGLGFVVRGFLSRTPDKVGQEIAGAPVVGTYEDVERVLEANGIDQVMIALPLEANVELEAILKQIGPLGVDIRVVPDIYKFISLHGGIEDFDGIPVVSLLETPLTGWGQAVKRAVDIVGALLGLMLGAPLFLAIAGAVWATSGRPVFFRQERMSLDGRRFQVWKFRTMQIDAEDDTGPIWAERDDPRRTPVGAWLRRWNLDELPQLWNVLIGEMSLVGPRPERPVFIEEFRLKVPRYMLRHKVRAGMTGWAQVNGFRGNTSVEDRVQHDLYYIENWSLMLDFKILLLTLGRGFSDPNAY